MSYELMKGGMLLGPNPKTEDIVGALNDLSSLDQTRTIEMRKAAYDNWVERFDSVRNADKICEYFRDIADSDFRELMIVTGGYPYGGEQSFIESEIAEIYKYYNICIVAVIENELTQVEYEEYNKNIKRIQQISGKDPFGLTVHVVNVGWSFTKFLQFYPRYFFDSHIRTERRIIKGRNRKRIRTLWESIKYYSKARYFVDALRELKINEHHFGVVYTFWHLYTTLGMCLYKEEFSSAKLITREHGYDLYDERCEITNRQPFREVMDQYLDGIIFACKYGKDYYLKRNNLSDNGKYIVGYLGTNRPSIMPDSLIREQSEDSKDAFRIVSCSNLIPIKRVDLIIKSIMELAKLNPKRRIEWIHFGSGELRTKLKEMAEEMLDNDNISYSFKGYVDNGLIHDFYLKYRVDCFITVSSTEGLPVSIMEAMSYCIPVIATDVGGIRETFQKVD